MMAPDNQDSLDSQTTARSLRDTWRGAILAHRVLDDAKRPCGAPLKAPHAYALLELLQHPGPMTVSDLADRLAIDRTNVSRLCMRMEEAGEIERQEHPDDARARSLLLTAAGRKLARRVDKSSTQHFLKLSRELGTKTTQVIESLHLLQQAMTQTQENK